MDIGSLHSQIKLHLSCLPIPYLVDSQGKNTSAILFFIVPVQIAAA